MYRLLPLTYFLEGAAIVGVPNTDISCSPIELLQVDLPPGSGACGHYMAAYLETVGGNLVNPISNTGPCGFCPISDADSVLRGLSMGTVSQGHGETLASWLHTFYSTY